VPLSESLFEVLYQEFIAEYKSGNNGVSKTEFLTRVNPNADRKIVFFSNVQRIIKHNLDLTATYKLGITIFADFTNEEFFEYFNLNDS